jgi:hypothetical protein
MPTFLRILTLYSWVLVGSLIYLLTLIARFYEKKYAELYRDASRQRTFYQLFLAPLLLFLAAAGSYALINDLAGNTWGDLGLFVGGILLALLSHRLQHLMTGGRQ